LLSDTLQGRDHDLHNRDSQASLGGRSTTHIRVNWPGYAYWRRQIPTRDKTYLRNPITVGRFMRHVGTSVNSFMNHCSRCSRSRSRLAPRAPHHHAGPCQDHRCYSCLSRQLAAHYTAHWVCVIGTYSFAHPFCVSRIPD